jgi:hypothetical protein
MNIICETYFSGQTVLTERHDLMIFLHLVLIKSKMFLTKYLKRCDLHCC